VCELTTINELLLFNTSLFNTVLVNMAPDNDISKKESKQLFGPDIGVVTNTPAWVHNVGKNAAAGSLPLCRYHKELDSKEQRGQSSLLLSIHPI